MAITITGYNHTAAKLLNLSISDEASHFYLLLVDGSTAFDATHTTLAATTNSGADELHGNGWTSGGENLTSVAVTTVNTDEAKLDAADISVTATGGSIYAPAAIIYVDEGGVGITKTPLWYIDFGETRISTDGNPFSILIDTSGLATVGVV